jgi:hypothetical protein
MIKAIHSSDTWALTRATRRHIPEDDILHKLRGIDNGALRRIFGPRRDELIGRSRGLHNEEFHNVYPP